MRAPAIDRRGEVWGFTVEGIGEENWARRVECICVECADALVGNEKTRRNVHVIRSQERAMYARCWCCKSDLRTPGVNPHSITWRRIKREADKTYKADKTATSFVVDGVTIGDLLSIESPELMGMDWRARLVLCHQVNREAKRMREEMQF